MGGMGPRSYILRKISNPHDNSLVTEGYEALQIPRPSVLVLQFTRTDLLAWQVRNALCYSVRLEAVFSLRQCPACKTR
jgi:hypothetical protein